MKRTRIRYKKLCGCLAAAVLILAALGYAVFFGITMLIDFFGSGSAREPGKPEYYLLAGVNDDQADSLLLAAVNTDKKELYAVSLPGCTKISREGEELLLLKDVYADRNAEKLVSAVENLLHIRIQKYAVFDEAAFSDMVRLWGGVDLYVEQPMHHTDAAGAADIELRQGFQTLEDGAAYGYMRYIDKEEHEIGRIQREERFMKALLSQGKRHMSAYNWGLLRRNWSLSDTNITKEEVAMLAYRLTDFPEENIRFSILPGEMKQLDDKDVWTINPVEIQKIIGLAIETKEKTNDDAGKN